MLRRTYFAIVSVVLALSSAVAQTQPNLAAPRFTPAEETIIARNGALKALMPIDPSGVRKVLDAVAAAKQLPSSDNLTMRGGGMRDGDPRLREGDFRLDPAQNPDLTIVFQRASPEAAHDLFQILKRVGSQSAAN